MANPQPRDENFAHEILIGKIRHLDAEGQEIKALGAQSLDGPSQLVGGHQTKRRGVGFKVHARMRLEADHADGRAQPRRGRRGVGDHPAVTQMHAVEIAQGHRCALVRRVQRLPAMENLQGQFRRAVLEP